MPFARLFLVAGVAATALASSGAAIASVPTIAVPTKTVSALALDNALLPVNDVRKSKGLRRANNALPALALVAIGLGVAGAGVLVYKVAIEDDTPASP